MSFENPIQNINNTTETKENDKERQEKEKELEKARSDVEGWVDAKGLGIDEGIKETVAVLNAMKLPTQQSCEGHSVEENAGTPWPWVRIGASNEPKERFVDEDKTFERAAKEHSVSVEKLKKGKPEKLYWNVLGEVSQNEETEEYKKWSEENDKLYKKVSDLLEEFYKNRKIDSDMKLIADGGNGMAFEIKSHDADILKFIDEKVAKKEKEKTSEKLSNRRREMREFTEFLKNKYFEK